MYSGFGPVITLFGGPLTENIPPAPPAQQQQNYPAPGATLTPAQDHLSHLPAPTANAQQPYQEPQQASASHFASEPQPGQRYAPAGFFGEHKVKASGRRTAAGFIGIILGVLFLLPALVMLEASHFAFMAFLLFLMALGNLTAGILLLLKLGAQTQWAPVSLLSTAAGATLLAMVGAMLEVFNLALFMCALPLAIPIGILLGLELAKQKRPATPTRSPYSPSPYSQTPAPSVLTTPPCGQGPGWAYQRPLHKPAAQQAYPYPPGQQLPPTNWQPKEPASPLRITTGVVALVLSVVGIPFAGMLFFVRHGGDSTPFNGWMNFFLIVGSIGCLVTGIIIMIKQRKRGGATPWLVISFSGLAVIACLGSMVSGNGLPGGWAITLLFALATTVLAVLVTVKDKGAKPKR